MKPVLSDFKTLHPSLSYSTFLGDSAFDSYDNYKFLLRNYGFKRALIPLNSRNAATSSAEYNENGIPVCPIDKTPMTYAGKCGGKNRSERLKFVCHKSKQAGNTSNCDCEHPCTSSSYGKCVYTYPDKNLRLYPGIARETEEWNYLYNKRVFTERFITIFKNILILGNRKTRHSVTTRVDLFFTGIVQLLAVIIADKISDIKNFRRIRSLIA